MPVDRTCNGGAYTFQLPGPLAVAETVVIPKVLCGTALAAGALLEADAAGGDGAIIPALLLLQRQSEKRQQRKLRPSGEGPFLRAESERRSNDMYTPTPG